MARLDELRRMVPSLEGLDDRSALMYLQQRYAPDVGVDVIAKNLGYSAPPESTSESRGVLRGTADLGLEVASGVTRGVGMLANAFGANNAVSRGARSADEFIREYLSAQSKEDSARAAEILAAAEDEGIGAQVVAGLRAFGQAPLSTLANTVGMAAPVIASALLPGAAAAGAARLGMAGAAGAIRGSGLATAGSAANTTMLAGMGGAQGAGAVKGAIFEGVKSTEEQAGTRPEEAERIAEQAQSYTGPNALNIAGGAALGGVAGATGFQPAAARLIASRTGMLSLPTEQLEQSLLRRMSQGALVEGTTEFAQGGQEQYATNVALQREGFDVPTFRGVVSQGTMEAVAGGALGAGFGALDKPVPRATIEDIGKAPTIDAAIKAAQDVVAEPAKPAAQPEQQDPLAARFQALQQGLADPALRETIRANLGEEALSEATYYASTAARTDEKLPEKTRARMMDLAEAIVQRATVTPVQNQAAIGSQVGAPGLMLTGPAGGGGGGGMLGLPAPTTPPVLMADAQGNVAPQPAVARTEALNRDFAARQEAERVRLQQQELGKQTPRGQEPPERFAPIPVGDATEFDQVPVGEASELIPTGDVIEDVAPIPTGDATVLPDDMLTGDGMPYGTKSGANMRARKEGLGPANVVEIPGSGWVVRPQPTTLGTAGREVQPTNTRGTSAADVLRGPDAADAAGNGSPGAVDPRRGDGGELLREQQRADVAVDARGADEQGVGGMGAAGLGTRGDAAPDDALSEGAQERKRMEAVYGIPALKAKYEQDGGFNYTRRDDGSLVASTAATRGFPEGDVNGLNVELELTPAERKAYTRAEADVDLADSPQERSEAMQRRRDSLRPAVERAIGKREPLAQAAATPSATPGTTPAPPTGTLKERLAARQAQAQGAPTPTAPGVESSTAPGAAQPAGGGDTAAAGTGVEAGGVAPKQTMVGKLPDGSGWGSTVGGYSTGDRRQLMVDPDGGYFWGDWSESAARDGSKPIVGKHAGFTPAKFASGKGAREAAAATPQTKSEPSGGAAAPGLEAGGVDTTGQVPAPNAAAPAQPAPPQGRAPEAAGVKKPNAEQRLRQAIVNQSLYDEDPPRYMQANVQAAEDVLADAGVEAVYDPPTGEVRLWRGDDEVSPDSLPAAQRSAFDHYMKAQQAYSDAEQGYPPEFFGQEPSAQAVAPATGSEVMPEGLRVTFGGKTYPVESIQDAQKKWVQFQESAGAGVSEVGNGVRVTDGAGRFVARISYNGRAWDGEGDNAKVLAEAPYVERVQRTREPRLDGMPAREDYINDAAWRKALADAAAPRVYKTKTAASMARKQAGNTQRLKKVKGGFILREATDKELAAAARAGRRLASGAGVDVENDSLLSAISKLGGLAMKERSDTIGEGNRNIAGKMLFRMTGKPLDRAIEELIEYGYIPAGEARSDPSRWLREAIKLEYLGTKQYFSDQGTEWIQAGERSAESLSDDELADLSAYDLEQSGYNSAPPEVQALTERLLAEAEALGIDTEAIREDAARTTEGLSQTDYELAVQQALTEAIARVAADAEGRNTGPAPAGGRDRGEADGGQGEEQEGLTLEAQDAESLREKTEREARAAADDAAEQRRLERKAQADAQRDEFTLTGSDRPADVAAAAGQGGLFDGPAPAPAEPEAPPVTDTTRPEALIALRKRVSVLKSLKECLA